MMWLPSSIVITLVEMPPARMNGQLVCYQPGRMQQAPTQHMHLRMA